MWIRSQGGTMLLDCDEITIGLDNKIISRIHRSYEGLNTDDIRVIGRYKSMERCLSVFCEIENKIINGDKFYKMPEE